MARLVVFRLLNSLISIALVSVALFALFELSPETVAIEALGQYSTPEQRSLWLEANGYLAPLHERFLDWARRVPPASSAPRAPSASRSPTCCGRGSAPRRCSRCASSRC
jgi:hypothetical protein